MNLRDCCKEISADEECHNDYTVCVLSRYASLKGDWVECSDVVQFIRHQQKQFGVNNDMIINMLLEQLGE